MSAIGDPEDDRPLKPPKLPREYETPARLEEAKTMAPPDEVTLGDVMAKLLDIAADVQSVKVEQANFQLSVGPKLARLEGLVESAKGDIKVIGADLEVAKQDIAATRAAVDSGFEVTNEKLRVIAQNLDGAIHLGKSTYDIAVDLKRHLKGNGHAEEESSVESEESHPAVGVAGR